ncbi:FAD-binding oxidoreductase [Rhodoferax saidenbachensis]|uniref:FAD-binding oxidoreductase n=1 Tax=Rhodoferax saidenbachensis TaxID=1484693 RepID=A0A1P8KEE1_9BURK|nr:FAD-binding oxidoreductase [Rhodoferax saidenbachensis]APW44335.1 FAD-binding oxidoreductase [Rhodoferax saidenbachensis]
MVKVASWGRLAAEPHYLQPLLRQHMDALRLPPGNRGLAHGLGRSYGDVGLNPGGTLWTTTHLDRFVSWDDKTGVLTCEAGVSLGDIQDLFIPRGWMLPVVPGTRFVTVGGAIANDVHGKNHHRQGSFGDHVHEVRLLRTDGEVLQCGPALRNDWFAATVGGLGLTGVITHATLALQRVQGPWLEAQNMAYAGLDEFFSLADASVAGWEHTVAWIDCLSGRKARGIFMRANPASGTEGKVPTDRRFTLAYTPPVSPINRFSLGALNAAYFHLNRRNTERRMHYTAFFHPLDRLQGWNLMYGPKGFYQYQCVIPRQWGKDALQTILREIRSSGEGSFLSVLKTFGDRTAPGMLSFAQPGVTLALDFPNHGDATQRLFTRLDSIVQHAGGRLYPAKDARMPRSVFEAGFPKLQEFMQYRDPGISSAFSRRTMGS